MSLGSRVEPEATSRALRVVTGASPLPGPGLMLPRALSRRPLTHRSAEPRGELLAESDGIGSFGGEGIR